MDNKITNAYELLFIVDLAGGIEAAEATANKFVARVEKNGEIIDVTTWGKRRLEYPINDKNEGYYTIITFRSAPEYPHELERRLNIDETVMRSLILKLDEAEAEKVARRAADKAAAAAAAPVEEAAPVVEEAPAEEAAPADAE
ncbi:MAG: 30S ribosomal protein S6 [Clostridia bacterium]|nr:30S ribosomal protein S6 [Clostridia bacterium]